jgi:beta-N-acetylhexosaminidase
VNQAVHKILDLKRRYIIPGVRDVELNQTVNTVAHRAIAQEIASQALKITKNEHSPVAPFHEKKIAIFAPQLLSDSIDQTSLFKIGKMTNFCFFSSLTPSNMEIDVAKQNAKDADVLFVCSYNAWKNPSQATLIQSLMDTGKPMVLLVMRDPLDASLFPSAHLIFNTFSPSVPSVQAVCDVLSKEGIK